MIYSICFDNFTIEALYISGLIFSFGNIALFYNQIFNAPTTGIRSMLIRSNNQLVDISRLLEGLEKKIDKHIETQHKHCHINITDSESDNDNECESENEEDSENESDVESENDGDNSEGPNSEGDCDTESDYDSESEDNNDEINCSDCVNINKNDLSNCSNVDKSPPFDNSMFFLKYF